MKNPRCLFADIGDLLYFCDKQIKNELWESRLDPQFTFEQAMQQTVAIKGVAVSHNQVKQMLKNWKKQGLTIQTEAGQYRKTESTVS